MKIVYKSTLAVLLLFLAVEFSLRVSNWFYQLQKPSQFSAPIRVADDKEIRVLCVGESMTFRGGEKSYPKILESKLNQLDSSKKWSVFNAGLPAASSRVIADEFPKMLELVKPDVVLLMMGLNDRILLNPIQFQNSSIQSMWSLFKRTQIGKALEFKILERKNSTPETQADNSQIWEQALLSERKTHSIAEVGIAEDLLSDLATRKLDAKSIQKTLDQHKNDLLWLIEFADKIQSSAMFTYEPLLETSIHFLSKNQVCSRSIDCRFNIANLESSRSNHTKAAELFDKVKADAASTHPVVAKMSTVQLFYSLAGQDAKSISDQLLIEVANLCVDFCNSRTQNFVIRKAKATQRLSLIEKQIQQMKERNKTFYFETAYNDGNLSKNDSWPSADQAFSNPITLQNIRKVVDTALKSKLNIFLVQYPTMSPELLEDLGYPKDQVPVIANLRNYEEALKQHSYGEIFSDNFAGSFGHNTDLGNEILVQAILAKFQDKGLIKPSR